MRNVKKQKQVAMWMIPEKMPNFIGKMNNFQYNAVIFSFWLDFSYMSRPF